MYVLGRYYEKIVKHFRVLNVSGDLVEQMTEKPTIGLSQCWMFFSRHQRHCACRKMSGYFLVTSHYVDLIALLKYPNKTLGVCGEEKFRVAKDIWYSWSVNNPLHHAKIDRVEIMNSKLATLSPDLYHKIFICSQNENSLLDSDFSWVKTRNDNYMGILRKKSAGREFSGQYRWTSGISLWGRGYEV